MEVRLQRDDVIIVGPEWVIPSFSICRCRFSGEQRGSRTFLMCRNVRTLSLHRCRSASSCVEHLVSITVGGGKKTLIKATWKKKIEVWTESVWNKSSCRINVDLWASLGDSPPSSDPKALRFLSRPLKPLVPLRGARLSLCLQPSDAPHSTWAKTTDAEMSRSPFAPLRTSSQNK